MATKRQLTVIDLFAGCGGLSLGLEQAGFTPVFVNELNEDALRTYLLNRKREHAYLSDPEFHCNDVKTLVSNRGAGVTKLLASLKAVHGLDPGEVDLVAGGPPCQGFSGIGHRRSYSVDKEQLPSNHLFEDMAFVVSRIQPRAFLFENVRGLLNARWTSDGKKGEIFERVLATFSRIPDYRVAWSLVYAKDYGVPQNRPRVIVVGLRDDIRPAFEIEGELDAVTRGFLPKPGKNKPPSMADLLGDLIDPNYEPGTARTEAYPETARHEVQRLLRADRSGAAGVSHKGDPVTEHEYSNHSPRIVQKFQAMLAHPDHEIPPKFRTKKFAQRVLPRTWGPDGPSITATSLPDDYVHFAQPRSLTVREWARIQMFPDWYEFEGSRTTGGLRRAGNPLEGNFNRDVPKYTQIGNAVPVLLAERVGKHLAGILRPVREGSRRAIANR